MHHCQHNHSVRKTLKKILWIGPVLNESCYFMPAVSPAACKWQESLIREFINCGIKVNVLTHMPMQLFPKGNLWSSGEITALPERISGVMFGHLNVLFLRSLYLKFLYYHKIKQILHTEQYDLVITYNIPIYFTYGAYKAQYTFGVPWVPLIADMSTRLDKDWSNFNRYARRASARIFFSWKNYLECPFGENLFFEGGVRSLKNKGSGSDDGQLRIVYAGTLTESAGFPLLLKAIKFIQEKRFEFHICGKGMAQSDIDSIKNDRRVIFHGSVTEKELEHICLQADAFINPRPLTFYKSDNNFPSKIHDYLQYQKPIFSTFTAGISPEYKKILFEIEQEDPVYLANRITELVHWNADSFEAYRALVTEFVTRHKLWSNQARKLFDWITETIPPR